MRRLLILTFLLSPWFLACNSEDPAPLYMEGDFQLRCINCKPTAMDEKVHRVAALNGEGGYAVACSAIRDGADRVVSFSVEYVDPAGKQDDYSLQVAQVNVDGANPGGNCRVQANEGNNSFEGTCTGGTPTDQKPCAMKFGVEHGVVMGSIECATIPNRADKQIRRYLVKPGGKKPAEFSIEGCTGL
jgi:hypothetical protein